MKSAFFSFLLFTFLLPFSSAQTIVCRKDTVNYYTYIPGTSVKELQYRIVYTFDINQNQTQMLRQNWDNTNNLFVNIRIWNYTYNSDNLNTQIISSVWSQVLNAWVLDERQNFTYDAQGNNTVLLIEEWDTGSNAWLNWVRLDRTYDANGNKTEEFRRVWNTGSSSWQNSSLEFMQYDLNDNQIEYVRQDWNTTSSAWQYDYKLEMTYNTNNQVTQLFMFDYDVLTSAWENYNKRTIQYDLSGNKVQEISQNWNEFTNDWTGGQRFSYTYNGNNVIIQSLTQNWNSTTGAYDINLSKTDHIYDSNGNNTLIDGKSWNSTISDWENGSQQIREFDANNFMVVFEYKSGWNAAANYYDSHTRQEFVCTPVEMAQIEEPSQTEEVILFPNPLPQGEALTIKSPAEQYYKLINGYGTVMLSGKLYAGFNSLYLDDLPVGLYVIQMNTQSIKFIKN